MYDQFEITESEIGIDDEPQGRKPRRFGRLGTWIKVVALVIMIAIGAVGTFLALNVAKVSVNPFDLGKLRGEADGRINIMLLGVGDPGHAGENLSDTNLLVSVNSRSRQVAVVSIPRDTRVKIPGHGSGKINLPHSKGGVPLAKTVMENTLGAPVHYYVRANFTGLKEVVDAVGGVDVNNPTLLRDPEYPCDNNPYRSCGFRLNPGKQHLDGATALKYVRCRKGTCGDDFGRAARQQEVAQSIRDRATAAGTIANPVRLGALVSAVGNNIKTDLSVSQMVRLAELTKGTDKSNIINVVFGLEPDGFLVSSGGSDLLPKDGNFSAMQAFVRDIFRVGPIWAEHATVVIQNGTVTPGLAGKLRDKIVIDGYSISVAALTNAQTRDHAVTDIIDYSNGTAPHTTRYLEGLLKVKAVPPATPIKQPLADLIITLGADYAQAEAASSSTTPPSITPPPAR